MFLGDLVDRGPDSPGVLRLVMGMVAADHALAVPGNHEQKLVRALDGRDVQRTHGLGTTMAQLAEEPEGFVTAAREFCRGLVSHLTLDGGALVVAHAGLKEAYQGRSSGRARASALYGDTTGESDELGLPVRYPWAQDYRCEPPRPSGPRACSTCPTSSAGAPWRPRTAASSWSRRSRAPARWRS